MATSRRPFRPLSMMEKSANEKGVAKLTDTPAGSSTAPTPAMTAMAEAIVPKKHATFFAVSSFLLRSRDSTAPTTDTKTEISSRSMV